MLSGTRPEAATVICAPSVFLLGFAETLYRPVVKASCWLVAATR